MACLAKKKLEAVVDQKQAYWAKKNLEAVVDKKLAYLAQFFFWRG